MPSGLVEEAHHPVIVAGNGARPFADKVIALAELLDVPIITTFKAKGMIGDDHPLASFSNHTGISERKMTIQVDADRMMLGRSTRWTFRSGPTSASSSRRSLERLRRGQTHRCVRRSPNDGAIGERRSVADPHCATNAAGCTLRRSSQFSGR